MCTKVDVFVHEQVREAAQDREGKRVRWCNNKARDFTHFLIHKSTLLVDNHTPARGIMGLMQPKGLLSSPRAVDCAAVEARGTLNTAQPFKIYQ